MSKRATTHGRLKRLSNDHKWFVGGGRRTLWAPEFPQHLDCPGFWDPGTYLEMKLPTLLTYTLIEQGDVLPLERRSHRWQPDASTTTFSGPGLVLNEVKTVTLDDAFRSEIALRNTSSKARVIDLLMWGYVIATDTGDTTFSNVQASRQAIHGAYHWSDARRAAAHDIRLQWTLQPTTRKSACTSYAVQNSEYTGESPDFRLSPFYELFQGRLPNCNNWRGGIEHRPQHNPHKKMVFVALHRKLRLRGHATATLAGQCQVTALKQKPQLQPALPTWEGFFDQTPVFSCSDPYLEKYYDYRWYGLRLNAVDYGRKPLKLPCVFEGINAGWFRHAISYSAQVIAKDVRWLHDPALAQGCILNFLDAQNEKGFVYGGLLTEQQEREWHAGLMYHADWGGAVQSVYEIHPDRRFLKRCLTGFGAYADYFDRERDRGKTGLYDVLNQAETGQEYMSRYLFVDPKADEWGQIQLKAVDATCYMYQLQRSLAWMATELDDADAARGWERRADRTRDAIREKMWDPKRRKFCDVAPGSGQRSPVKALTDFYPFLSDVATRSHLPAIKTHLLNPKAFWTPWPAPATALDDPTADAYGRWLGKRMNCPWNGRTWLMTNSHIADVLARAARTLDPQLEAYAVTFITRFIYMLYVDRDLDRPTSFEYYNPVTGQAPFFRATDDYMHSYIVDLILRHVVGLQLKPDGSLWVQPLQFGLQHFHLANCVVAGRPIEVSWDGKRLSAKVGRVRKSISGWGKLVFDAPA
jgi:hypothetical protein